MLRNIFHKNEIPTVPPTLEERRAIWAEQQQEWEQRRDVPMTDLASGQLAVRLAHQKLTYDYADNLAVTAAIDTNIRTNQSAHATKRTKVLMPIAQTSSPDTDTTVEDAATAEIENSPVPEGKLVQLTATNEEGHSQIGFEFDRAGDVLDWDNNPLLANRPVVLAEAEDGSTVYVRRDTVYHYKLDENGQGTSTKETIDTNEAVPPLVIGEPWKRSWYLTRDQDMPPAIIKAIVSPRDVSMEVMQSAITEAMNRDGMSSRTGILDTPDLVAENIERQSEPEQEVQASNDTNSPPEQSSGNAPRESQPLVNASRYEAAVAPSGRVALPRTRASTQHVEFEPDPNYEIIFGDPATVHGKLIKHMGRAIIETFQRTNKTSKREKNKRK